MARRRRRRSALDYISVPKVSLEPETKRGIFIILILVLGALSLLGLFNLAGSFGGFLASSLVFLFGWGKWLIPLIFLTLAFLMYNEDKYNIKGISYIGVALFMVSFYAFLHFFIPRADWSDAVEAGDGGGYFGMLMATIFNSLLGFWGGLLVLICLLLVSLMLMFDVPLGKLVGRESLFGKILYPFNFILNKLFNRSRGGYKDSDSEDGMVDEKETEEEPKEEELIEESDDKSFEGFSQKEIGLVEPAFMTKEKKPIKQEPKEETGWKPSHVKIDLPFDLLNNKSGKATAGDIKNNILVIQRTLENFGINVEMGDVSVGPTVTQYTFKPAEGIKLSKITTLSNDLALALAAHPIRIEAPIPGKSLVGIEVPNKTKAIVGLREILEAEDFKHRKGNLMIALGKDVAGKAWLYDITKMPHLLVAGATNSGKSVCLNAIIVSLLYQNNPDDLKFIMVDPKRVELPVYNEIPHLLTPVITDVPKTINALKWCLNEMDRRFELLSKHQKRNIQTYNESVKKADEKIPYLVFVVDELADLMVVAARDIEGSIIRLAQMARAVGIHLILATQRPSVDVITGLIKANMPARIAFSVASGVDSKTILDSLGAEKLLGQGDMLFQTAEISKPKRIQGAYLSDKEIKNIVDYMKEKGGVTNFVEGITERQRVKGIGGAGLEGNPTDEFDELFDEAKEIVINSGKASTSLLQRRLSIGYARAARVIDELEEAGIIGPGNGSKPREILLTKEQYAAQSEAPTSGVSLHSRAEAKAPDEYFESDNSLGEVSDTPTVFKPTKKEGDNEEGLEDVDSEDEEETSEDNAQEEAEEVKIEISEENNKTEAEEEENNKDEDEPEEDEDGKEKVENFEIEEIIPKEPKPKKIKKKNEDDADSRPGIEEDEDMFFAK